jgi:hypothetical protein
MTQELFRGSAPAKPRSVRAADFARDIQRRHCRSPQIPIQRSGATISDHVQWTGDRQCRYREPASHCLEQHKPEGLGTARQHEHIGRRIVPDQRFALLSSGKIHFGIAAFHFRQQVAIADDEFRARQIELQKRR